MNTAISDNKEFSKLSIKNQDNTRIINEFKRYYFYIYNNFTTLNKPTKELFYKLSAIKKVIITLSNYKETIKSGEQVKDLKNIGIKTINRINEILKFGFLSEIKDNLEKEQAINNLSNIYGIGNVKASLFYEKYNIKNIDDLINAEKNNKITLTDQMKLGIKYYNTLSNTIPQIYIAYLDTYLTKKISKIDKKYINIICGSYRRNKPYSSDIDILITHKNLKNKNDTNKYLKQIIELLDDIIIDKLTNIETSKNHFQGFISFNKFYDKLSHCEEKDKFDLKNNVARLDVIVVPENSFYTALMHFTGSYEFNQKMRIQAKQLNMKLSEYGLYLLVNNKYEPLKINSEEEIFDKLFLKYIKPEFR